MRVVLATSVRVDGGVLRHMLDLASGLQLSGDEVVIEFDDLGSTAAHISSAAGYVVAMSGSARGDVWHLHVADTFSRRDFRLVLRRWAMRQSGMLVLTEHLPRSEASDPTLGDPKRHLGAYACKTFFKRAEFSLVDRVITVSSGAASFLNRRYNLPATLVTQVHNGVAGESLEFPIRDDGSPVVRVLAVGSLIKQKGFDLLIESCRSASCAWDVRVVGEGPHRAELSRRSEEMRTAFPRSNFQFIGWSDDIVGEMKLADVVVVPSRWESSSYATLDAMAAARSVVAFAIDGVEDAIMDGVTGRLVQIGDLLGFAQAIDEHLDASLAQQRGDAGRARVASHFSLAAMVSRTRKVYSS